MTRPAWIALCVLPSACGQKALTYAEPLPRVRVAPVVTADLPVRVTLWGEVAALPGRDVSLGSLESGYLAALKVREGDPVRRDEVLAEVTAASPRGRLEEARARLAEQEAKKAEADARARRAAELLSRGAASTREAEATEAAARVATASLDAARAVVDLAERHVAYTEIRSPLDGVVVRLLASPGQPLPGQGQPVLEVADTRRLEVDATATAAEAARLVSGQDAELSFPGSGVTVRSPGRVVAVSPALDPSTATTRVRIALPEPPPAGVMLRLYARADVQTGTLHDALWVPATALLEAPGLARFVLIVTARRTAQRRKVEAGARSDGRVQILSGLTAGEEVVVEGGYGIPDGAAVEVER